MRVPASYLRALWPSLLVAIPATALLFAAVDPREILLFGQPAGLSSVGLYTVTLLAHWGVCWAASVLNLWMFGSGSPRDDRGDGDWDA